MISVARRASWEGGGMRAGFGLVCFFLLVFLMEEGGGGGVGCVAVAEQAGEDVDCCRV